MASAALAAALAFPAHAVPAAPPPPAASTEGAAPSSSTGPGGARARAQAPFECTGDIMLSAGDVEVQLYYGVTGPGTIAFDPVGAATTDYNAIGVNPDDQYIYAIERGATPNLLRIDDTGAVTNLGSTGLPVSSIGSYASGAFDNAGNFYVASGYDNLLYRVDVTARQATPITLSRVLNGVIDFAYSDGYFWGADITGLIARIDPTTGQVNLYPGILPDPGAGDGYGGAFTYGNGDIGFYRNGGTIYRVELVNPADPSFRLLSTQDAPAMSISVDATSCFDTDADLGVTKTGPATVTPGGDVAYTITVTNNGPAASSGWTLNDLLPEGLTDAATTTEGCAIVDEVLSCTGGPLAVGASTEVTLTGKAADDATVIVNTTRVYGNDPDPNPDNDEDTTTTTVERSVDLAVTKSGPAAVDPGGEVSYTITVTNNGPSDSTGWTLVDAVPAGLNAASTTTPGCTVTDGVLSCAGGPLAVGDSVEITFSGEAASGAGSIVNTARVYGNDPDPDPDNNEDTTTTVVGERLVDLAVVKSGPAEVAPGGAITYRITVTNNGPFASSGWSLSDVVPAQVEGASTSSAGCSVVAGRLSCSGGALAVGESVTVRVSGTVAEGATGTIRNTAVVTGEDPDPDPDNNEDTTTTIVTAQPGLTITKKQDGPATVDAGAEVAYTITVTNTGSTTYTEDDPASFTDDLSDLLDDARYNDDAEATRGTVTYEEPVLSWSGALAPGQTATITFSITTDVRTFGDLKLDNTVVSDTPGNNCPVDGDDPRCTTHGKVRAKDKD